VEAIARRIDATVNAIQQAQIRATICTYFGDNCRMATAIFTAESGLNPRSMGWNCYYTNAQGRYSASCKPGDRNLAWSVDCGIAQLNFRGQVCPEEAFDYRWNIEKAYEWKFKPSGWNPWTVYKTGSYLAYL
jgi:hypothetical protein